MNKNKILIYLIVLLAMLNISTIGTIIYHNFQEKKENNVFINNGNGRMMSGRFFMNELNFDNNQMNQFRNYNHSFRQISLQIINNIDSLKSLMFVEMQKPKTDTATIYNLSEQIGNKHKDLKIETAKFYLEIKKICNIQQQKKLNQVFYPLFAQDLNNKNCAGWKNKKNIQQNNY